MRNLLLLTCVIILFIIQSGCSRNKILDADEIPIEIVTYVRNNFPEGNVLQVVKTYDDLSYTFEVILQDATRLEFDSNNEIIELKSDFKLPESTLSQKINNYVEINFPRNFIKAWEYDDNVQQITLDNGIKLRFDNNNEFVRID